jgi:hypothetical protein
MKRNKSFKLLGTTSLAFILFAGSCSDVLEEQPRSVLTPGFFQTEQGISSGLTAVYSHMRFFYGPIGGLYTGVVGTDEATYGDAQDGGGRELDTYGTAITPNTGSVNALWNNAFPFINTCNGIIDIGTEAGMPENLIAEAKFFRAHDYFLLVATYGGVPLDLGGGELKFNTAPIRISTRNNETDVYTKVIFPDLEAAVNALPVTPRVTGGVTQTAAQHFLAKAYLTYGWWLERHGQSAGDYYTKAYNTAMAAINDPGPFALQKTFHAVNLAANDRNSELLLFADHTSDSYTFDESGAGSTGGPNSDMKSNRSNLAINMDFELAVNRIEGDPVNNGRFVYRRATQELGRPWRRVAPTQEVLLNTFADKTDDSRYDGTFITLWRANYQSEAGMANVVRLGMNNIPIVNGDTVFYFPPTDEDLPILQYSNNDTHAYYPGKAYAVWAPSLISRHNYPSCWKFGPDRQDKSANGPFNDASTRPFPIAKLSETYLIAAEAALKSGQGNPRELLLAIRRRAALRDDNTDAQNAAAVAAMEQKTPATIDIDYILAERSRELYAENLRWYDLTRTGKLEQYAGKYTICETNNRVKQTITRDIRPHHYLRPIPQGQLNNMDMSEENKGAYQNPGY